MARNIGTSLFSANFEPRIAASLDARSVVQYKADLTLLATWDKGDGNAYVYKGMLVVVTDDATAENNGVYRLIDNDYTQESNWEKLGSGGSTETYNRIEVDEIPYSSISFPFSVGQSSLVKYFQRLGEYYNLFLFEVWQNGDLLAKDLFFINQAELEDWINNNATEGLQTTIRCYYYEDTKITSISKLAGRNGAYSLLKSGKYFSTAFRTLGDAYQDCY